MAVHVQPAFTLNVLLQGLDHRSTYALVGTDDLAQVFRVELTQQDRGSQPEAMVAWSAVEGKSGAVANVRYIA